MFTNCAPPLEDNSTGQISNASCEFGGNTDEGIACDDILALQISISSPSRSRKWSEYCGNSNIAKACVQISGRCNNGLVRNSVIKWSIRDPEGAGAEIYNDLDWKKDSGESGFSECKSGYFRVTVRLPMVADLKKYEVSIYLHALDEFGGFVTTDQGDYQSSTVYVEPQM